MGAKTREEIVAEYQQYGPTALSNLEKILKSDIANCDESINDPSNTAEWVQYWQGAKADYELELDVCQEFLTQIAS